MLYNDFANTLELSLPFHEYIVSHNIYFHILLWKPIIKNDLQPNSRAATVVLKVNELVTFPGYT
jgi:hypothetical protein